MEGDKELLLFEGGYLSFEDVELMAKYHYGPHVWLRVNKGVIAYGIETNRDYADDTESSAVLCEAA
jgi:hypothetical protein